MSTSKHGDKIVPTAYREPLYPFFISRIIALSPELRSADLEEFLEGTCGHPGLVVLQYAQIPILLLTALLGALLIWRLTRKKWTSAAVMITISFSERLLNEMTLYRSEILACLLVVSTACCFLLIYDKKKMWTFVLGGFTLGLLTLTKGIFQYIWIFVPPALLFVAWREKWNLRNTALGVMLLLVSYACVVSPWYARNHHHFGRWYLTGRGGAILLLRSQYDAITCDEYKAALLYWLKSKYTEKLLVKCFDEEDWIRLDRSKDNPKSIYQENRRVRRVMKQKYGTKALADEMMMKKAKEYILDHPWRHLALTIPLALRGILVEKNLELVVFKIPKAGVSLALFFSFISLLVISLWKMNFRIVLVLAPAVYCWGMYAGFSHALPRYNIPMLPILWLSLVLLIDQQIFPLISRFMKFSVSKIRGTPQPGAQARNSTICCGRRTAQQ